MERLWASRFLVDCITSIAGLLRLKIWNRILSWLQSKKDEVCADCDMFVKALILPGITLPETVNIQSSMSYIPFQKLATQTFLASFQFLRRTSRGGSYTISSRAPAGKISPVPPKSSTLIDRWSYDVIIGSFERFRNDASSEPCV